MSQGNFGSSSPSADLWETLADHYTEAMHVHGLGVLVRVEGTMAFVPGARIKDGWVVREDREAPLSKGFQPVLTDEVMDY